ncbi:Protein of uncharacterised function (DUF2865) [Pannonibacter phragmitetus]|uniref:Protein of uncharacterized function (DUF2865) n=2 Tax=Pannonibacter phragmitetus TaxID=121719 RepID=A0A378ZTA3_9HYPH|nr:Protein of uncharacterised function (DUF2865) [Pannonibacter phragmitetus]
MACTRDRAAGRPGLGMAATMKRVKYRLLALSGLMALAMGAPAALASTSSCEALARQLSRLETAGTPPGASKWDEAADAQARAILAARRDAAHYQCGLVNANARCPSLLDKIQRMETNLAKIERQRSKAGKANAGRGGTAANRAEILRIRKTMQRNMCGTGRGAEDAQTNAKLAPQQPRGLLTRAAGQPDLPAAPIAPLQPGRKSVMQPVQPERRAALDAAPQNPERTRDGLAYPAYNFPRNATYRTLCVRTCDGYFFPISFSARPGQFGQDAAACNAMCPAAETGLFVYRNPGGDPEDMISLAGERYSELPNAFRHRKEYVNGCSCQAAPSAQQEAAALTQVSGATGGILTLAGGRVVARQDAANPQTDAIRMSMPPVSADDMPLDADPDTALNLREGFDASSLVTASLPAADVPLAAESMRPSLPVLERTPEQSPAGAEQTLNGMPADQQAASPEAPAEDARGEVRGPVRKVGPQFFPDR